MAAASIISPRCSVCTSEHRVVIDNLLSAGAEVAATARRFQVGKFALRRHFASHVSNAYKLSVKAGPFGSEENLRKLIADGAINDLETLEAYRAIIGTRIVANLEVGADSALAALMKAGHDNVALHAKITGGLAPTKSEVTVNVMQDPRTIRFVTQILDLVREFPQTRPRVTEMVRECFGEADGRPLLQLAHEAADA